jgi:hypothetical protein
MTPKEKAIEIYREMSNMVYTAHYTEKQCALVAVGEILDLISSIYDYDREVLEPYWKQVKQELEKL